MTISVLAQVHARCWHSGPDTTKDAIESRLTGVCSYLISDSYVKGEHRYQCVVGSDGVKWDFSLEVCSVRNVLSSIAEYHSSTKETIRKASSRLNVWLECGQRSCASTMTTITAGYSPTEILTSGKI